MSTPQQDDDQPLDPAAARIVARVRLMMVISGVTTLIAVIAVLGVIGYRLMRTGPAVSVDATGHLPRGARIVATAVAEDRIVVTLEVGGATEIRTYDLRTLQQAGRLRFAAEP